MTSPQEHKKLADQLESQADIWQQVKEWAGKMEHDKRMLSDLHFKEYLDWLTPTLGGK